MPTINQKGLNLRKKKKRGKEVAIHSFFDQRNVEPLRTPGEREKESLEDLAKEE